VGLTLSNLDELNKTPNTGNGKNVSLTSNAGIRALPTFLDGVHPANDGSLSPGTIATAVVTVEKANNTLDAFFFFFYAYNRGDWIFELPILELGDHVGDWEHVTVRFQGGLPQQMWFSQHSSGSAFSFSAVRKFNGGSRPVVYSANGTHANYPTPGDHPLPLGGIVLGTGIPIPPLTDHTDDGILWDPLSNAFFYRFDNGSQTFTAYNGQDPTAWLNFNGIWGDVQLPINATGQIDLLGQIKFVNGPTGPKDKNLGRISVCDEKDVKTCVVQTGLPAIVTVAQGCPA
jgi:hypothetical protein